MTDEQEFESESSFKYYKRYANGQLVIVTQRPFNTQLTIGRDWSSWDKGY